MRSTTIISPEKTWDIFLERTPDKMITAMPMLKKLWEHLATTPLDQPINVNVKVSPKYQFTDFGGEEMVEKTLQFFSTIKLTPFRLGEEKDSNIESLSDYIKECVEDANTTSLKFNSPITKQTDSCVKVLTTLVTLPEYHLVWKRILGFALFVECYHPFKREDNRLNTLFKVLNKDNSRGNCLHNESIQIAYFGLMESLTQVLTMTDWCYSNPI